MKLTVIDTPGFGDQINNENWWVRRLSQIRFIYNLIYTINSDLKFSSCVYSWEPISKYINEQYEKFLKEEVNIARKKRIPDTRVHCCLYFISPTGHS